MQEHLQDFFRHAREAYDGPLPKYVKEEFRKYLECGDFSRGFVHVQCPVCHEDHGRLSLADSLDRDARRFYERHGFVNIEAGCDYRMLCYPAPVGRPSPCSCLAPRRPTTFEKWLDSLTLC